MGRGLNVLPVSHEFAPGQEPDVIEIVVGVFGGEWKTEQFVIAGFCLLVALALLNFVLTRARRRRQAMRPDGVALGGDGGDGGDGESLGDNLRALRRARMRSGVGPGGNGGLLVLDKDHLA